MNILYFITHDTGRFLGCCGRPIPFSPNLDRFAAEGVRFANAHCSAPCCGPSRNCAMTGKYSHVTGTLGLGGMGWLLPDEEQTVVDYMNTAGYETFHAGFCHERLYGEMRYQIDGKPGDEKLWKCDARLVVDHAIEYLNQRDGSKPFYMNLATHETHASNLGGNMAERHGGPVPLDRAWVPPTEPDLPETRERWAHFGASLQYVDLHFGRLMRALDELGLRDDTLVVYTTDHGTGCQRGKMHIYEPGTEIALLVRPPSGMKTGYVAEHLIPNIDFMPTWLEAAGVPVPGGINGRSFWPLLKGGDYTPNECIFTERNFHGHYRSRYEKTFVDKYDPQRSVHTRDFHYVRHMRPLAVPRPWYRCEIGGYEKIEGRLGEFLPVEDQARPSAELYDLRHDPWEQHNVAGQGANAEIENDLSARLDRWMRDTNDPALSPEMPRPLQDPPVWPKRGQFVGVERV